jgi:hypothetical protein
LVIITDTQHRVRGGGARREEVACRRSKYITYRCREEVGQAGAGVVPDMSCRQFMTISGDALCSSVLM